MDGSESLCSRFEVRAALFVPGGRSAYRPRTVHVESAGLVFFVFVTCSCVPLFRSVFPVVFGCREFGRRSAWGPRTVREEGVVPGRSDVPPQTVRYCWYSTGGLRVFFEQSAGTSRTVRRGLADSPPGAHGQSAWYCLWLLSPLLLDSCFRFGIVWSFFLGLVGPL
jgi:hypothetical protein